MQNWAHSKIRKSVALALLESAAISGCRENSDQRMQSPPQPQSTLLPYLLDNGTRYPYFTYSIGESSLGDNPDTELAVFVYPILSARNQGLALPYMPTQNVRELFGEELFGRQFSVITNNGVLSIDGIPLSRPIELQPNSKWKMTYEGSSFACKVTRQVGADFSIKCDSGKFFALNHQFNIGRGFTSYQDFCGKGWCTYKLTSSVGILSPYHVGLFAERPNNSFKPSPLRGLGRAP